MAKKKATKKKAKAKRAKSTEQDIKDEDHISKDIAQIESEIKHDESLTKKEVEEVKRLDEEVASELADPKKQIEEVEKANKKTPWTKIIIYGIAIIIIILGFLYWQNIIFPRQNMTEYNGFELRLNGGYWETNIEAGWLPFRHHPTEVDEIPVDPLVIQSITNLMANGGNLILTVDPNDPAGANLAYAGVEISKVTAQLFSINTSSAFKYELEGYDKDIVTCRDAKALKVVLQFETGPENKASIDDFCVTLQGISADQYPLVADAVAYRMLGIITN